MTYIVKKAQIYGKKAHEVDVIFNYITKRLFVYNKNTSRQIESFFNTFPIQVEKTDDNNYKLKLSNVNLYFDNIEAPQQYIQHTISQFKLEQIVWKAFQSFLISDLKQNQLHLLFLYHINTGSICFVGLNVLALGSDHFERFFYGQFVYVLVYDNEGQKQKTVEIFIPNSQTSNHNVRRFLLMLKFSLLESGNKVISQNIDQLGMLQNNQEQNDVQEGKQQILVLERTFKENSSHQYEQLFTNFTEQYIPQSDEQELANALKSVQSAQEESLNLCAPLQQLINYFTKQNIYQLLRMPWQLFLQFGYRLNIFHEDFYQNKNLQRVVNIKSYTKLNNDANSNINSKILLNLAESTYKLRHSSDEITYFGITNGVLKKFHTQGFLLWLFMTKSLDWKQILDLDYFCVADINDKEVLTVEINHYQNTDNQKQRMLKSKQMLLHFQDFFRHSQVIKLEEIERAFGQLINKLQNCDSKLLEIVRNNFIKFFESLKNETQLTETQKTILNCLDTKQPAQEAFMSFMMRYSDLYNLEFILIDGSNQSHQHQLSQVKEIKSQSLKSESILFIHLKNFNDDGQIVDKWCSWRGQNLTDSALDFLRKQQSIFQIEISDQFIQNIETTQFLTLISDFNKIQSKKGLLDIRNIQYSQQISKNYERNSVNATLQVINFLTDLEELNISVDELENSQQFEVMKPGKITKTTIFKNGYAYLKIGCNYLIIINQGQGQELGIQLMMPLAPPICNTINKFKVVPWQGVVQSMKCVILSMQEERCKFQHFEKTLNENESNERMFYIIKQNKAPIYLKEAFTYFDGNTSQPYAVIKSPSSIELYYVENNDVETIKKSLSTFPDTKVTEKSKISVLQNYNKNIQQDLKISNAIFYLDTKQVWFVSQSDACVEIQRLFQFYIPLKQNLQAGETQIAKNESIKHVLLGAPIILLNQTFIISLLHREVLVQEPLFVQFFLENGIQLLDMQFISIFNATNEDQKRIALILYQNILSSFIGFRRKKNIHPIEKDFGFLYESAKYFYKKQIQSIYEQMLRNEDPKNQTEQERYNQYLQLRKAFIEEFKYGTEQYSLFKTWLKQKAKIIE